MKYFLPILLLALCQVAFIKADYTVVDPADYDTNPQIQDSLNYGGEYIVQLGISRNVLPEDNYQISQIKQIEQDVLANGADYRFNVNIASDEGVKVAALYTVYYRFSTNAMKVVSYQYNYTYPNDLKNSTEEFSWEDYDFNPTETETETEGGEGEGETEFPGEGECPGEEEEWTCPGEEEGTTPGEEEEWTCPGEEEGTNPGEEEGNIPGEEEGNLPGEEEWVCEEAEGPLAGWPNEWVEIIEESN